MAEPPSSPPSDLTSPEDAIAYYKAQYELLENELADFQASSQELEAELEKDVEAAEKRERVLQEKAESLGFEVEEWKVCQTSKCSFDLLLMMIIDQIQAIKNRGKFGAECVAEGDHYSSSLGANIANETARYGSGERRLRKADSEHNLFARRYRV